MFPRNFSYVFFLGAGGNFTRFLGASSGFKESIPLCQGRIPQCQGGEGGQVGEGGFDLKDGWRFLSCVCVFFQFY